MAGREPAGAGDASPPGMSWGVGGLSAHTGPQVQAGGRVAAALFSGAPGDSASSRRVGGGGNWALTAWPGLRCAFQRLSKTQK